MYSSLNVEYLIKVKMVKLPGDDSKYVMVTVFWFSEKNGLIIKPKKNDKPVNRQSLLRTCQTQGNE